MLSKLRRWLSGLFGGRGDDGADGETDEADAAHVCAVCGTPVSDPDGTCSLCRSTDVVPADEAGEGGSPAPAERREAGDADEAAARLRDVRNDDG